MYKLHNRLGDIEPTYEIVDHGRPPRDRDIAADSRDGLVVDKA